MADDASIIVAVGVMTVLAMVGMIGAYAARYKRVAPNQALVVFGRRYPDGSRFRVLTSGGHFVQPIVESYGYLSLEPFKIDFTLERIAISGSRPAQVTVAGSARIPPSHDDIARAAGHFVRGATNHSVRGLEGVGARRSEEGMQRAVVSVLEGRVRDVVSSAPSGITDAELGAQMAPAAKAVLYPMGIELVSFSAVVRSKGGPPSPEPKTRELDDTHLARLDARLTRIESHLGLPPMI